MKAVVKSLLVKAAEVIYFGLVPLHIYIPTLFDGFSLSHFAYHSSQDRSPQPTV
jgi:hypothetical protein